MSSESSVERGFNTYSTRAGAKAFEDTGFRWKKSWIRLVSRHHGLYWKVHVTHKHSWLEANLDFSSSRLCSPNSVVYTDPGKMQARCSNFFPQITVLVNPVSTAPVIWHIYIFSNKPQGLGYCRTSTSPSINRTSSVTLYESFLFSEF